MEATLDLGTIFERHDFSLESYQAVKELAFSGTESVNRLKELLHALEERIEAGTAEKGPGALKLGLCHLVLANTEKAEHWLQQAEEGAIKNYFLGQLYLDQGRSTEAAAEFVRAAGQGWDQLECDCLRAEALVAAGDHARAEEALSACADAGKETVYWHFARARVLQEQGEAELAIESFEAAHERDESHAKTLFHLAYLLSLHGCVDRAKELYLACAELPVVHSNALVNLAIIHEDDGEYEEAQRCLRRVLLVNHNNPRAELYAEDVEAIEDMYIDEQQVRDMEKRSAVLDIPVTDFELSVRSRNCLKKMNIHTLGDLLRATEPELLAYKNFGETSLREIKAMLTQKGLSLGQYAEDKPETGSEVLPPGLGTVPEREPESMGRPVSGLKLSVRSRKCLQRLGISTVGELISKTESELLESRNFGQTSLVEIKSSLLEVGLSLRSAG